MANPITVNIIFTRHGYSCANAQRNAVGYKTHVFVKDPQLHPIGIQEATALGRLLAERNIPIHAFCCSQLFRTMQTAHYIKTAYERTKDSMYHLNEPLFPPIAILPGINELGSITSDNTPHTYETYRFDMKKLEGFVGSKLVDLSDGDLEFITDKGVFDTVLASTIVEPVLNMLKLESVIGDTVNILIASHHAILKKMLKKGYAIDIEGMKKKIDNTDAIVMQRFKYNFLPSNIFKQIPGNELTGDITDKSWLNSNNSSLFNGRCIYRAPLKVGDAIMKNASLCPPNYAESPATFKNAPFPLDKTVVMKDLCNDTNINLPTGDIGATLLANELYFNPNVTSVDITDCNVTDVGAFALSNASKKLNKNIQFTFKDGNKLTPYGIRLLIGRSTGGYTKKTHMRVRNKTLKKQKVY